MPAPSEFVAPSVVSSPSEAVVELLGLRINALTMVQTLALVVERIEHRLFTQHAAINVAKLVNMQMDSQLREAVSSCDVINADGMGVVWGARFLGCEVPERVAGIDLFERLLQFAADREWSVYFLGARDEVIREAVARIEKRLPQLRIAGWHHGYFWENEEEVVDLVHASGADLLFVGITSPRKEQFINRWRSKLGVRFAMGVGGSFDVVAGKTRRAPEWIQKIGLEWLFRMLQEPRRMAARYIVTNTRFALILAQARWRAGR
jgi:N-acetylglucosaminyldiphosphoundecaprenol N-acetyl-beta-D-mannosaminyltransferase